MSNFFIKIFYAPNVELNIGSGGKTIATLDEGGVQHEKTIEEFIDGGGNPVMVSAADPLPVTDNAAEVSLASIDLKTTDGSQKTQIVDGAGNVIGSTSKGLDVNIKSAQAITLVAEDIEIGAVELKNAGTDDRVAVINAAPTTEFGVVTRNIPSGTQAVSASSLPLPTGAATAANQQTNALTDAQLRATPVPVSGTITPSGTQDENLIQIGGTNVDVNSGNKSAGTQRVVIATDQPQLTNALKVDGSGVTQPVSGTFFQATQPVSAASLPLPAGAATAANQQTNALTDAQLRASAVPVSNASLPLPAGASTEATLALIKAKTDNIDVALSTRTKAADQQHVIIDSGSGGAATIADGADVALGAIADAIVAAGAAGTSSAKLRRISQGVEDLKTLIALAAGSNLIGKVGIDQTTPGTTNKVSVGSDTVTTSEVAPTTILNGQTTVTTSGTRVVLAASTVCKSVTIKAFISNTGFIYVGNSTVSSANGFRLSAGDTVSMDISNLNTVNIDSAVNGESVSYLGVN